MTNEEILRELASGTRFNEASKILYNCNNMIEQAYMQDRPVNPFEIRRLEFEAVKHILKLWNIDPRSI